MTRKESHLKIKSAKLSMKLLKLSAKLDKYNIPFHIKISNKTYLKGE